MNPELASRLYSIGYSDWPARNRMSGLLTVFMQAGIRTVVDVRLSPCSSSLDGNYGPKEWTLQPTGDGGRRLGIAGQLEVAGLRYEWIPELGNPQKNDKRMLVFEQHLADKAGGWPVHRGLDRVVSLLDSESAPLCLLCMCADLQDCHISLIIEALRARLGWVTEAARLARPRRKKTHAR